MLKPTDLKIGMKVVFVKITKKYKRNFSEGIINASHNKPMTVVHIEYPLVVFEYIQDQYKHNGPFESEKVGTKVSNLAMNVKGLRFKEVSEEYCNMLKDLKENENWLEANE